MRIVEIQGTNMDLTEAIKDRLYDRLTKISDLLGDTEPADIRADLGKTSEGQNKGRIFRAELNLQLPGALLRAEEIQEDLYASIDLCVKDLRRQVIKWKETR